MLFVILFGMSFKRREVEELKISLPSLLVTRQYEFTYN